MKKWIIIILAFILISAGSIYLLIPSNKTFTSDLTVNCTEAGATRLITNKSKWHWWWPGKSENQTLYSYKNCNYRIDKIRLDGFEATVFNDADSAKTLFQIFPDKDDASQFIWTTEFAFSNNPFKRSIQYFQSEKIKSNVDEVADRIKKSFEKEENVYGMKIIEQKVADSSLISLKQTFNHYPSSAEIYGMINSIKNYILKKGGEEKNFPMLNIYEDSPTSYEVMVAVPTKHDVPSEGNFQLKKMVLGNILMAEVKGGIATIKNGEEELTNYVKDHHKVSPAIPFQSLVTNRIEETDTSKWITRLYYPVFY